MERFESVCRKTIRQTVNNLRAWKNASEGFNPVRQAAVSVMLGQSGQTLDIVDADPATFGVEDGEVCVSVTVTDVTRDSDVAKMATALATAAAALVGDRACSPIGDGTTFVIADE